MFRELLGRARDSADGARARADVAAVSAFHRVQSSPGYDEAARWLEAAIARAGLEPERREVPGDGRTRFLGVLMPQGWACDEAVAVLEDGRARERLCAYPERPLSLVLRSDPVEGRFPLVDVGRGSEPSDYDGRDVRGRVVLASGPVHRVHRLAVVERGAAGILTDTRRLLPPVRGPEDLRDALHYTSFWWNESEPRGWGFVVSPATGDRLRARLADGAELVLDARVRSRRYDASVPLLSATLGPRGGEEVLVTAHLCHPFACANDNGSGVAAALEAARVLAALEREGRWRPRRAVRFLWMPELTGTHAWLGTDPGAAARTVAALNLDMVGQDQEACGSTLLIEHPPCFSASFAAGLLRGIRDEALDWVESFSGPGHYGLTRVAEVPYSGGSDHVVWSDPAQGVPCPMLIQWPDRFYHSSEDTVARTSPASLALAVRCAATYAGWLAAAGTEEAAWLAERTLRDAGRRLLAALDGPGAAAAAPRERLRATRAIESLARLGVAPPDRERALARFASFAAAWGVAEPALAAAGPVPVRGVAAPLDFHVHLWPGFERLDPREREDLRSALEAFPGGASGFDVAWSACDGRRTIGEVASLAALESGTGPDAVEEVRARLARILDSAARMGVARLTDAPRP